jgi:hypothetical protein
MAIDRADSSHAFLAQTDSSATLSEAAYARQLNAYKANMDQASMVADKAFAGVASGVMGASGIGAKEFARAIDLGIGKGYAMHQATPFASSEAAAEAYTSKLYSPKTFTHNALGLMGGIGINQALEYTVFKDKPIGAATVTTDIFAPAAVAFVPGNAFTKAGLIVASHVAARAFDAYTNHEKLF